MENTMVIKKDFSVIDYVSLVNGIADEFFDVNGEYQPHLGRLNVMRLFYNECVTESKFDLPHDFNDALMLEPLIQDEEFIAEFNKALKGDGSIRLDFANAYAEAMEIVNVRKGSFGNAVDVIKGAISNIIDMINPVLGTDNIEKFKQIADSFTSGNLSADAIIEAFGNKDENK